MSRSRHHGAASQRQLKVNELLRKALSEVFLRNDVEDPDLDHVTVTVTEVRVSPDLRSATVFVVPRPDDDNPETEAKAIKALQRHQRFLRGELARRIELKYMPSLSFKLDDTFARSERIDALLRSPKVSRDIG